MSNDSPNKVLASIDPKIKSLINLILKIEKEYRHIGTLNETHEDDICQRIIVEIEKVAKNENQ